MEAINEKSGNAALWISDEVYEGVKEYRHAERKETIKEAAHEIIRLGLAVTRGEYVKREEINA